MYDEVSSLCSFRSETKGLLQHLLSCRQEGREQALHPQSQEAQLVPSLMLIQDGHSAQRYLHHDPRSVASVNRLEGCLH